jgi:hypothetical protein
MGIGDDMIEPDELTESKLDHNRDMFEAMSTLLFGNGDMCIHLERDYRDRHTNLGDPLPYETESP